MKIPFWGKKKNDNGDAQPVPPSTRQLFHELLQTMEKGLRQGDPRVWHRILLAVFLVCLGVILTGVVLTEAVISEQSKGLQADFQKATMAAYHQQEAQPGNYLILRVITLQEDGQTKQLLELGAKEGGATFLVPIPQDVTLPADKPYPFYYVQVTSDGRWIFHPIQSSTGVGFKASPSAQQ